MKIGFWFLRGSSDLSPTPAPPTPHSCQWGPRNTDAILNGFHGDGLCLNVRCLWMFHFFLLFVEVCKSPDAHPSNARTIHCRVCVCVCECVYPCVSVSVLVCLCVCVSVCEWVMSLCVPGWGGRACVLTSKWIQKSSCPIEDRMKSLLLILMLLLIFMLF